MTKPYRAEPIPDVLVDQWAKWNAVVEQAKPRGRCRGCAFRPGTVANRDGKTVTKVAHTLIDGGDFRCHHKTLNGPVCTDDPHTNRPCAGFTALINGLFRLAVQRLRGGS